MQKNRSGHAIAMAIQPLESRKMLAANVELLAMTDQATNSSVSPTLGSILIYDVSDIRTAGSDPFGVTPLFSIWPGYEITAGGSGRDFEELTAFAVSPDGKSGYLLSFDSGTAGSVAVSGDSSGDYDLYRIDINAAYNDFKTNNRARGIMYAPRYSTDYDPANPATNTGIDYIDTYGGTLGPTGQPAANSNNTGIIRPRTTLTVIRDNTDTDPSNDIIFLDGVTRKIAEVARVQGVSNNFFNQQDIQVVNDSTIVLMENSNVLPSATGNISDDYSIRTLERVSTSPGLATPPTGGSSAGGYNRQTSESWNSVQWTGDNYVQMDPPVSPGVYNISDVDGMRYVDRDGTKGVWVSDRDGTGDDMSFFGLNFATRVATKQEQRVGPSPYPKAFAMDEDPTVNPNGNDGEIDGFDLDANGNLVIREGSFNDTPKAEPKIVTRAIANYNAGDSDANSINELTFGAWSTKAPLTPTVDDDPDVTNGLYATYDQAQGLMYYFDIDTGNPLDVYVYDLATQTLIFQKLNIAGPFLQDGNQIRAFTLGGGDAIAPTVAQTYAFQTEQSVTFAFSEALATSGAGAFSASDITLTNTTTNTVIPTADLTLVSLGGNQYKLTYKTGAATTPLPRGVYTVTLNAAGITDVAGNALTPPATLTFKVNPGDTNQDGDVDFDDLLVLAQNYGSSGKNYSQGNVSYDAGGVVNFDDLLLLAQNYGTTLVQAARTPAKRTSSAKDVIA